MCLYYVHRLQYKDENFLYLQKDPVGIEMSV